MADGTASSLWRDHPQEAEIDGTAVERMPMVKTKDGVEIYDKDCGQPIVFCHGWPLSSGDWNTPMLFFLNHGYRGGETGRIPIIHTLV
jgi:pimeloyl-ACP methyl ester carboxylesterase